MSHFNDDTPPDKKKICPPLTVYSIISFAWGMTLLISQQQDTQGKIASESLSIFRGIRAKYHNENPHDKFLDEISFHMYGYFRTIAIKREIYFINLKTWETKRQKIVDYWNDLSNMTSISFSIQGIIVKIATFFGIGSIFALVNNLLTSKGSTSFSQPSIFENPWFFIGGLLGLVGIILLIKFIATKKIQEAYHFNASMEQALWRGKAWSDYKKSLLILFDNVIDIMRRYYPDCRIDILDKDKITYVENMIPGMDIHRGYHKAFEFKTIEELEKFLEGEISDLENIPHWREKDTLPHRIKHLLSGQSRLH